MRFDVAQPIHNYTVNRDETLIVYYDGFIKNITEGVILTMLSEIEDWEPLYPGLSRYDPMTVEEVYDETSIFQPAQLLEALCEGKRTDEEIFADLDNILPRIYLSELMITNFEFVLANLLDQDFVKQCYIYREGKFNVSDKVYLHRAYRRNRGKITLVDQVNFIDFYEQVDPTTVFTNDISFVFDYVMHQPTEKRDNKMFVVLNNASFLEIIGQDQEFIVEPKIRQALVEMNDLMEFGVSTMFNFRISSPDDLTAEDETEENTEEEDIDNG